MREWIRTHRKAAVVVAGLLFSGAAAAFPWDIDMYNGVSMKAYEWKMRDVFVGKGLRMDDDGPRGGGRVWTGGSVQRPQGAVARPNPTGSYQNDYVANLTFEQSTDLKNPFAEDAKLLALGKKHYGISCAPCHGMELEGGGPVTYNDATKNINRFPIRAPGFKGDGGVLAMSKLTDGQVYNRVRNGYWLKGDLHMPGYGASLTERERWAVVAYLRSESGVTAPSATPAPSDAVPADATNPPAAEKK
jgi:mono/diheme cytochrome c family protein